VPTNDVIIRSTCSRFRVITVEHLNLLASKKAITNLLGLLDPADEGSLFLQNISTITLYQLTWCNIPEDLILSIITMRTSNLVSSQLLASSLELLSYIILFNLMYTLITMHNNLTAFHPIQHALPLILTLVPVMLSR
jgi:hypothetical protein